MKVCACLILMALCLSACSSSDDAKTGATPGNPTSSGGTTGTKNFTLKGSQK